MSNVSTMKAQILLEAPALEARTRDDGAAPVVLHGAEVRGTIVVTPDDSAPDCRLDACSDFPAHAAARSGLDADAGARALPRAVSRA